MGSRRSLKIVQNLQKEEGFHEVQKTVPVVFLKSAYLRVFRECLHRTDILGDNKNPHATFHSSDLKYMIRGDDERPLHSFPAYQQVWR